jgi:hypothetical protein
MNIWDLIAWFFWSFVFITYLMLVFSIIGDIFRDTSLNGWLKAVWIIALMFVPLLTALVYLIARGPGMAQRDAQRLQSVRSAQADYIRDAAGRSSSADEIAKAKQLLDGGAISQAEFDGIKAKVLA